MPMRFSLPHLCVLFVALAVVAWPGAARAQFGPNVINSTTTNTTSTFHHETDIPVNLPDITIPGGVNSQQFLKRIVNNPDQTVLGWSKFKSLDNAQVQEALNAALSVLEKQKPQFHVGADLLFVDRHTSLVGNPGSSNTAFVGKVFDGTTTSVSNTTTIGPGTVLFGTDQLMQFFVVAGNQNINTNTHTETFFENDFQKTITTGGQALLITETDVFGRTIFIDLNGVYSLLFSGLPVAMAQRDTLVNAHSGGIGDVNDHIFRLWLGGGDTGPQGDTILNGDVRLFASGNAGWLSQGTSANTAGLRDTREAGNVGAEWKPGGGHLRLGLAMSYVHSDTDYFDNLGKQHIDGGALSVYANWRSSPESTLPRSGKDAKEVKNVVPGRPVVYYADFLYSAGLFDDTTDRNTLTEGSARGSATDWSHLLSLNLGAVIPVSDTVSTGPYASLTYVHGHLSGYDEHGGGTAALSYSSQNYNSLVTAVGWQASWKLRQSWGSITPVLHLGWERENLKDSGDVNAALLQSPFAIQGVGRFGSFGVGTQRQDARSDSIVAGLGTAVDLGERWSVIFDATDRNDFGPRNDLSLSLTAGFRF